MGTVPALFDLATRDLLLKDWGEPITMQQVQEQFDPTTGERQVDIDEYQTIAVSGLLKQQGDPRTIAHNLTGSSLFLVDETSLPSDFNWLAARLLHGGHHYRIDSVVDSLLPAVRLVTGYLADPHGELPVTS